jgi:hypothetical protein
MKVDHRKVQEFSIQSTTGFTIEIMSQYSYGNMWIVKLECPETGETDYCRYIAEYNRGLEEVGLGPTPEDIGTINQMLGEMVQEFCTDRMLVLDDEYQQDYRVATVDEAMESLSTRDSGKIIVDNDVVCFVQF